MDHLALPTAFVYSTIVMLLFGDFWWGKRTFSKGNSKALTPALVAVLILGLVFMWLQAEAWGQLMKNIIFAGAQSHPSGSWVYAFLSYAAHVLGGIIALIRTLIRSLRGYSQKITMV